jgi:hypothetical protein
MKTAKRVSRKDAKAAKEDKKRRREEENKLFRSPSLSCFLFFLCALCVFARNPLFRLRAIFLAIFIIPLDIFSRPAI